MRAGLHPRFTARSAPAPAHRACAADGPGRCAQAQARRRAHFEPGQVSPSGVAGRERVSSALFAGGGRRWAGGVARLGSGGGITGTCPLRRLLAARGSIGGEGSPQLCCAAGSPSNLAEVGPGLLRPLPSAPSGGENAEEEARADSTQPCSGWIRRQRDQLCRVSAAGFGGGRGSSRAAPALRWPPSRVPDVWGAVAPAAALPPPGAVRCPPAGRPLPRKAPVRGGEVAAAGRLGQFLLKPSCSKPARPAFQKNQNYRLLGLRFPPRPLRGTC